MRVWTDESRAAHAALMRQKIRAWKPWTRSTGPRTAAGKKIVAGNALKHGGRCAGVRRYNHLVHQYRVWVRRLMADLRAADRHANKLIKQMGFAHVAVPLLC